MNVGIICPSEIAFRRFLPSLQKVQELTFAGVAIASPEEWAGDGKVTGDTLAIIENERKKAQNFINNYGGKIFEGYETLITSPEVDIVYLPLPPALHYKWARMALESGKHAYVEKPFTTCLEDTQSLLAIAKKKRLVVHLSSAVAGCSVSDRFRRDWQGAPVPCILWLPPKGGQ